MIDIESPYIIPTITEWLINVVGINNIEYDFKTDILTFLHEEDAIAFRLKFNEE